LAIFGLVILAAGCQSSQPVTEASITDNLRDVLTSPDESEAGLIAEQLHREREEYLFGCMAELGLPYERVPSSEPVEVFQEPDFIANYGYGFTTTLEPRFYIETPAADPNSELVASLTSGEQEAWAAASGDCFDEAIGAVEPSRSNIILIEDETQVILDEIEDRIDADPRTLRALGRWSSCASTAGFDYQTQQQIIDYLGTAVQSFASRLDETINSRLAQGEDPANVRRVSWSDVLTTGEYADLSSLQEEEIRIAIALEPCDVEYDTATSIVETSVRQEYLDKYGF